MKTLLPCELSPQSPSLSFIRQFYVKQELCGLRRMETLVQHCILGSGFSALGSLMLDAKEQMGLAMSVLNHLDQGTHVLIQPKDIGAVLEVQRRVGVAESVDGAVVAIGPLLQEHSLQQRLEANRTPVG